MSKEVKRVCRLLSAFILYPSAFILAFSACEREERGFRVEPPSAGRVNTVRLTELQPGPPVPEAPTENEYEKNAYAVAEGQTLYKQMNCVGCHARGGGGMGPALMDEKWIYGSDPAQVFATIVQGRPNGMPSFRGKLNDDQVWKLAAYVRSLSGQVRKDVAPGRTDDMSGPPPPASTSKREPKDAPGIPKSAEMPQ
jgi:cytochrome c oxidase cbb3-type subunit III